MATRGVPYDPTPEQRAQVQAMAGLGLPFNDIAAVMTIDRTTLMKHYRQELNSGLAQGNLRLARGLMDQALGRPAEYEGRKRVREELKPAPGPAIFLAKNRLGMKDRQDVALTLADMDLSKLNDEELTAFERLLAKAAARRAAAEPADGAGGGEGGDGPPRSPASKPRGRGPAKRRPRSKPRKV